MWAHQTIRVQQPLKPKRNLRKRLQRALESSRLGHPGGSSGKGSSESSVRQINETDARGARGRGLVIRTKGGFRVAGYDQPQVHALDQEFIADILQMRQIAPQLEATDAVTRCQAMVRSLSLLDRVNTIDERKLAAMSQIVDQEAAKLGIELH